MEQLAVYKKKVIDNELYINELKNENESLKENIKIEENKIKLIEDGKKLDNSILNPNCFLHLFHSLVSKDSAHSD